MSSCGNLSAQCSGKADGGVDGRVPGRPLTATWQPSDLAERSMLFPGDLSRPIDHRCPLDHAALCSAPIDDAMFGITRDRYLLLGHAPCRSLE